MLRFTRSNIVIFLLAGMSFIAAAAPGIIIVSPEGPQTEIRTALAKAQPGDTIEVHGGEYQGPLKIDKSVVLIGRNRPVIDGHNRGTVVEFAAPDIYFSGFEIRNSGKSLSQEDAGISVNVPGAIIENNRILHVLFGIYLRKADRSLINNNLIIGKKELPIPRRGDLVRIWYSNHVHVLNNELESGRDMIIWFSKGSIVRKNTVTNARYGVHFMYSDDCRIEDNILTGNSVGVYLMYSRRLILQRNTIAYNRGPSGFGIGLKDFDDGLLIENLIVDNRVGIFVDNSPREIESTMTYKGNVLAYNDIGVSLLSFVRRSTLTNNSFMENYEQVGITGAGELKGNIWEGNYWSDYAGYDRGDDGVGDLPYKSQKLFEDLMDRKPSLRLFIYSPAIQALDFAARAFPMVKPKPKVVDPKPQMNPDIPEGLSSVELPTRWPLATAAFGLLISGILLITGFSVKAGPGKKKGAAEPAADLPDNNLSTHEAKSNGANFMIETQNLIKRFGKLTAVDDVSFRIKEGEAVAFWGSNGAGKTTVLRCLLGVIPFEGKVRINGYDVLQQSKEARRMIGFVPQEISFHDNLSVEETMTFYAQLKKTTLSTIAEWIKRLGLQPHTEKTIKELSGGMKQRLALAIALLADPPILFLDEPTANLDMRSRDDFLELLSELKQAGKTIIFSSHRLEEVFSFADRVLILDQGKLITDSAPHEVYEQLGKRSLLRLYVPEEMIDPARDILEKHGFSVSRNGAGIKVQVNTHSKGQPITILANEGVPVSNFEYELEN